MKQKNDFLALTLRMLSTASMNVQVRIGGTGFNALLVGYIVGGNAGIYGAGTHFWSGSAGSATVGWRRHLNSSNSGVNRGTDNKYDLFSVRCKKQQ